ncbi:hypothetical protein HanIR_Chr04g0194081 [Helianthus annuus]|nr:hypothetical protein HanIR_Chr04g0194081 [Helianthus annuus]
MLNFPSSLAPRSIFQARRDNYSLILRGWFSHIFPIRFPNSKEFPVKFILFYTNAIIF